MLQDSFQTQLTPSLPASMTQGVITLLYKGKGARSSLDSHRPIILLNSDYKLLAKALATRLGPALQHVIDPTQTAFVPGRWIGDNVLCHLEEVEYLQQAGQPGCIVFLDFSKAYDRLSRSWVQKCMSGSPGGQLPYKPAHQTGIVSAQTCQTHSQPGWLPQGVADSTGQSGNSNNRLSNNNERSNPGSFLQTDLATMTPWMCLGNLTTPLSWLSGADSGS